MAAQKSERQMHKYILHKFWITVWFLFIQNNYFTWVMESRKKLTKWNRFHLGVISYFSRTPVIEGKLNSNLFPINENEKVSWPVFRLSYRLFGHPVLLFLDSLLLLLHFQALHCHTYKRMRSQIFLCCLNIVELAGSTLWLCVCICLYTYTIRIFNASLSLYHDGFI